MIVFGTRGKIVQGPQKRGIPCSACGTDVHATSGVLRWFHVFWIPIFPTLKQPALQCVHCRKALVGNELPPKVRRDVAAAVFTRRQVLPAFAGAILLAVVAVPVAFAAAEQRALEAEWVKAPAVGDLYVVKLSPFVKSPDAKYPYGVLRVASVSADRIELRIGTYAYALPGAARKAIRQGDVQRADYFAETAMTVGAADVQRWSGDHTIQSVSR